MSPKTVLEDPDGIYALPVRPRPIGGEAAIGYLIRVAHANGYERPRQLWRNLRTFDALCGALKLTEADIKVISGICPGYWVGKHLLGGLGTTDFSHRLMRWCPLCFRDVIHLKAVWSPKLVCVCDLHQIWLHQNCPECGKPQRLERTALNICECGANLCRAPAIAVSPEILAVNRALLGAFRKTDDAAWPALDATAWYRLIRYLGQFADETTPQRPGQPSGLERLEVASRAISVVAHLLADWPRHFHELLATTLRNHSNSPSLRRSFGRLYQVLYADLSGECFQFLRAAFEEFINDSWWGLVCRRHRGLQVSAIEEHPRLTVRQMSHQTGAGPRVIQQFVQAELIPADEAKLPSGRTVRSLHRDYVPEIARLMDSSVSLVEAAKLLAIPRNRLRELIDAGVLVPLLARHRIRAARWMLPREQLAQFCLLSGPELDGVVTVRLREVLKNWHLREFEFSELMRALLSGELRFVGADETVPLGEKRLSREVIREWLCARRRRDSQEFSVDQFAKMLGLKQEVAYQLVRSGLIKTASQTGIRHRIDSQALEEFRRTYVSLATLARRTRKQPRKLLSEIRVAPVCGPTIDGCRQYFFRRKDLAACGFSVQPSTKTT